MIKAGQIIGNISQRPGPAGVLGRLSGRLLWRKSEVQHASAADLMWSSSPD